ncbi:phosphoribosylaminoimidazolesuccinocarboxamide synthase [Segetibacter sp. 3557_3]|uniref:phosphoribosylaminoimidazolesuccinocarboxamide synthase n=1 Tax=Segetibacter sp. 3557_3 TaxID=2547429 RepID=UPI001058E152|nr:phosphoribosylaminoimidazolesuccinocarboxamide synthase [Segetibacter sp. 3557_3]TDH28802.1 phosphoribosylaminoimidazolesuccinocarboxamide synthase [Segetibacter sp. 3557_3]
MSSFTFPGQQRFYSGKVRDVYYLENNILVMVASDRISAFDVILPRPIPFKGQVLNQVATYMLERTRDICPNWLLDTPAPNTAVGKRCDPFKIEMVVRGNLTGHAWRTYSSGKRSLCGVAMEDGMRENDFFAQPIITPSTKADVGHDEDISKNEIIAKGLASAQEYAQLEAYALELFTRGRQLAKERGLILVDTKYEFGKIGDTIYLMDEIHTPDSSRYFYADGFEGRLAAGEPQKQLSKEFVREWLIANNFMGKDGQQVPEMTEPWVQTISRRYIELYEVLIGEPFKPEQLSQEETYNRIIQSLEQLSGNA